MEPNVIFFIPCFLPYQYFCRAMPKLCRCGRFGMTVCCLPPTAEIVIFGSIRGVPCVKLLWSMEGLGAVVLCRGRNYDPAINLTRNALEFLRTNVRYNGLMRTAELVHEIMCDIIATWYLLIGFAISRLKKTKQTETWQDFQVFGHLQYVIRNTPWVLYDNVSQPHMCPISV